MNNPIETIKSLIDSLPKKDIELGYKFLTDRDFVSLKELVDSAIYKVKKSLRTESPKEEYLSIDIENLSKLKSEVDLYLIILEPDEYREPEECECEIEEEEFY